MHYHYLVSTAWFCWLVDLCGGYAVGPASLGSFGTGLGTGWYKSLILGSSPSKIYFELGTTGLIEDDPLSSCSVISSDNVLSLLSA